MFRRKVCVIAIAALDLKTGWKNSEIGRNCDSKRNGLAKMEGSK